MGHLIPLFVCQSCIGLASIEICSVLLFQAFSVESPLGSAYRFILVLCLDDVGLLADPGLLSSPQTLVSVAGLVTLTSSSLADVSTELLRFDSSPIKRGRPHNITVAGLSSPNKLCLLCVLVRISFCFLAE